MFAVLNRDATSFICMTLKLGRWVAAVMALAALVGHCLWSTTHPPLSANASLVSQLSSMEDGVRVNPFFGKTSSMTRLAIRVSKCERNAESLSDAVGPDESLGHAALFIGSTEVFAVRMSLWGGDDAELM
jgi:hypothetical protein